MSLQDSERELRKAPSEKSTLFCLANLGNPSSVRAPFQPPACNIHLLLHISSDRFPKMMSQAVHGALTLGIPNKLQDKDTPGFYTKGTLVAD